MVQCQLTEARSEKKKEETQGDRHIPAAGRGRPESLRESMVAIVNPPPASNCHIKENKELWGSEINK